MTALRSELRIFLYKVYLIFLVLFETVIRVFLRGTNFSIERVFKYSAKFNFS